MLGLALIGGLVFTALVTAVITYRPTLMSAGSREVALLVSVVIFIVVALIAVAVGVWLALKLAPRFGIDSDVRIPRSVWVVFLACTAVLLFGGWAFGTGHVVAGFVAIGLVVFRPGPPRRATRAGPRAAPRHPGPSTHHSVVPAAFPPTPQFAPGSAPPSPLPVPPAARTPRAPRGPTRCPSLAPPQACSRFEAHDPAHSCICQCRVYPSTRPGPQRDAPRRRFQPSQVSSAPGGATVCRGCCAGDLERDRGPVAAGRAGRGPTPGCRIAIVVTRVAPGCERAITGGWLGVLCDYEM